MKTKCMSCGGSMKKMAVGGTTTKRIIKKSTGGMYGIPQENMGTSGQYGFGQKGGTVKKRLKKTRIIDSKIPMKGPDAPVYKPLLAKKGGTHKMPNGKVMLNSKMKTGGATKATKFAALAPPYDKATFADKIVGAKKSAGSKKLPKAQFGAFIKAFSKVVKPIAKIVKPASKVIKPVAKRVATTSKKNIPKEIDFRNTKNSMERMMGSKQIQNYFKKSTQRDQLLKLVNKNKN